MAKVKIPRNVADKARERSNLTVDERAALDKLFDVKKDEQQALKSFSKKGWFG